MERMGALAGKAQEGPLMDPERTELDNQERVGHSLVIMQSKARAFFHASCLFSIALLPALS